MRRALLACVFLGLGLPLPAAAQVAAEPQETIEVTARRDKERRQVIRNFVGALSNDSHTGPMTRFDTACPVVAGLSPAQNLAVANRMRTVASAAAIPLAKAGCQPNILVIVVPDKFDVLKGFQTRHPAMFRNGDNKQVDLVRDKSAALAWHVSVDVDRFGKTIAALADGPPVVVADGSPRLYTFFRPVAVGGVVLIDQAGVIGLTTTQIADYATMRIFSTAEPRKLTSSNAPTILRIMDSKIGDETPPSLTAWDFAFLKAAYAVPAYRGSGSQRAEIQVRIDRELSGKARR